MANAFVGAIKKVYPFISAAAGLGGPFGVMAANAVGKAIGVDKIDPSCDAIHDAIASAMGDDTKRLALLQQEQNFSLQMAELGYKNAEDLERIAADDRASARDREKTLKDKIPASLAIMVTLGFFGVLAYMLKWQIPATGHDAMLLMLGGLGSAWTSVVAYYFGSSSGSASKDATISKIASGN